MSRASVVRLAAGTALLCAQTAWAAEAALRRAHLELITTSGLFRGVRREEVVASGKVWLAMIARRRGIDVDVAIQVSSEMEPIRRRIAEASVALLLLDAMEYVGLNQAGLLEPLVAMSGNTNPGHEYRLVVRKDSGIGSLEELRGKSISVFSHTDAQLGRLWLDVTLDERRLGRATNFFASVAPAAKPSQACLPVFFGKMDACIVDDSSLAVLEELNPQVGAKLTVLASSPALVEAMIALHRQHPDFRDDIKQAVQNLHQDPQGRQVLTMFKSNRAVPVTDKDLEPVRELRRKYLKLAGAAGAVTGGERP